MLRHHYKIYLDNTGHRNYQNESSDSVWTWKNTQKTMRLRFSELLTMSLFIFLYYNITGVMSISSSKVKTPAHTPICAKNPSILCVLKSGHLHQAGSDPVHGQILFLCLAVANIVNTFGLNASLFTAVVVGVELCPLLAFRITTFYNILRPRGIF